MLMKCKSKRKKAGKKKLFLDDRMVRAVLNGDNSAVHYMMKSYDSAAASMVYTIADEKGVSVTMSEAEELIQQMWTKILLDRLPKFTDI